MRFMRINKTFQIVIQRFYRLLVHATEHLNDYKVEKKFRILYIFCMLIPLIITDSVILAVVIQSDRASSQYALKNISSAMKYNFTSRVEKAVTIADNIYTSRYINDFLNQTYESTLDYYIAYQDFQKDTLLVSSIAAGGTLVTLYSENKTLVNGGEFSQLNEKLKESDWYKHLENSGKDKILYAYFDESNTPTINARRKISLIRKLNFYQGNGYEKILKLDLDYTGFVNDIVKMNYEAPVYICQNGKILFSNEGYSSVGKEFAEFTEGKRVGYEESFQIYGQEITLYVLRKDMRAIIQIRNNLPLILFLILFNAILPWLFMNIINRSFTGRLRKLGQIFETVDEERLQEVKGIQGKDEIGALMQNYNKMAVRMNGLIQTLYKDRLKEQEINIARQNAELLALHSQINPHFLFNALESVRMHSLLKGEKETAHMVERLAVMERQYVDWGTDFVTIEEEMGFAEAYLELQKYRFGERLSYSLEVSETCKDVKIPKLTIVTFVENACVHGVEGKPTPGWVFVRVFPKNTDIIIEIEDTGNGISEPFLTELRQNMSHAGIASLRKKGSVGIMNACLRLRMMTADRVRFELESEEGAGTIVTVKIPLEDGQGGT